MEVVQCWGGQGAVQLKGGGAVLGWTGRGAAEGRLCSVGGEEGAVQLKGSGALLGVDRERCS